MTKSESVDRAIEDVRQYTDGKGWKSTFDEETCTFQIVRQGERVEDTLYFRIVRDREEFLFYIVPELAIPRDFHPEVVEYITRVNCGTRIGNFEFDYRDEKVRYKSSVSFKGDRLSLALIAAAVEPALVAWRDYLPGVIQVVAGTPPERALNRIDYGL